MFCSFILVWSVPVHRVKPTCRFFPLCCRYHCEVVCVARPARHHRQHLGEQQHRRAAGGLLCRQCCTYGFTYKASLCVYTFILTSRGLTLGRWCEHASVKYVLRDTTRRHGVDSKHQCPCPPCVADVDPVVFQCLLLVDLFLCRWRLPGGENICRNQVHTHSLLSPL